MASESSNLSPSPQVSDASKDAHERPVQLTRMSKQFSLPAMARTSLTLDAELPDGRKYASV